MKKTLRNLLVIAMVLALSLSGTAVAFADGTTAAPANSGINVQYNGENIAFTDAAPQIVNGRTMVPFRQILETMGAEVTYDNPTKTVLAVKKDMEFSFTIGGTDITIKRDGKTSVKKMDVAPFIDKKTNRTYVPARFMAESMNYSVSWDQAAKTAVIIDPTALFANADKDFSIISKLLNMDMDLQKTYETTGSFLADVTVKDQSDLGDMNFSISGDMSGIQHKTNADMVMNMVINADKMLSAMSAQEQAQMKPLLDMFKNINMKIKMDGESGDMYMNSNIFSAMDPTYGANTWFKMNIYETYDQLGIDIRPIMNFSQSELSVSQLLQTTMLSMNTGDVESYANIKIGYAFMKNLIGNEAFKSTTSGTVTTHTLNLNKSDILAAISKTALAEGVKADSADMAEITKTLNEMSLNTNIVIKEKNGKLYNYDMNGDFSFDGVKVTLDIAGDTLSSTVKMAFEQPDMIKMSIKADSKYTETTKTVDLKLPADAKVLDYNTNFMPAPMK